MRTIKNQQRHSETEKDRDRARQRHSVTDKDRDRARAVSKTNTDGPT